MAKYSKTGNLRSSSGSKVTNRKQAVAIGISEARAAGAKAPPQNPKLLLFDPRLTPFVSNARI